MRQFSFLKPEFLNTSSLPSHLFLLIHTEQAALEPLSCFVSVHSILFRINAKSFPVAEKKNMKVAEEH